MKYGNIYWELIDNAVFQLPPCCHILTLPLSNFINAVIASLNSCKISQVSILISKGVARGALGLRTDHFENLWYNLQVFCNYGAKKDIFKLPLIVPFSIANK